MVFLQNTTSDNENFVVHRFPSFPAFSPLAGEHLKSYRKRKSGVKHAPHSWVSGRMVGTHYNDRDSGPPFLHAAQHSGRGWRPNSSPPTSPGAGNSINQPLPNYRLTN